MTRVLALALLLQADDPRAWIRRLDADEIDVRAEAAERLVAMGRRAVSALVEAAKDDQPEVRGRARVLLRRIEVRASLTAGLLKWKPAIDRRIIHGDDHTWTIILLEAIEAPELEARDLEVLVAPALAGARHGWERRKLCRLAEARGFASAAPVLVRLLEDPNGDVRTAAVRALAAIGDPGPGRAVIGRLRDRYLYARAAAADAVSALRLAEAAPALVALLEDPQEVVRERAFAAFVSLGDEGIEALRRALKDADPDVRRRAEKALRSLEGR